MSPGSTYDYPGLLWNTKRPGSLLSLRRAVRSLLPHCMNKPFSFCPTHSVLSLLGIINFPLLTSLCSLTFYSLCSFSCQVFGGTPARFQVRPAEETSEWTVLPHISQEAQLPGLLPQLAGAFPPMAAGWGESVPFLCPKQACDFVLGFCPVSLCLSASKLGPAVFVCGSYFHETCRFF